MKMTESEKNLWLNGDSGLKPYLRLKDKGMPRGKIEQIAWLLLNGSGCGFCKVCRDKSCDVKDGEGCTGNIARYIRETVINELDKEKLKFRRCNMGDIERLLLKIASKGLVENLSRNKIGLADLLDDGIHYYLDGQEYLITCKKVEDDD